MIRVDDDVWAALTEQAAARGYSYRGRLNQGRVVEDLVRGTSTSVRAPAPAQRTYKLPEIVASWPAKTQEQWKQEQWKAIRWVKLVLQTINGTTPF